jgi:hypothetical protein
MVLYLNMFLVFKTTTNFALDCILKIKPFCEGMFLMFPQIHTQEGPLKGGGFPTDSQLIP